MTTAQMKYRWRQTEDGLTLIETLIALAIFSIGILAVAQLQMWNIKNNTTGNITTQATMLARAKLEELKNDAEMGTNIEAGSDFPTPNFERSWSDDVPRPAICTNCRQIDVTVTYKGRGQNRDITLTTILR